MNDLFLHDSLDTSPVVFSDRILYTPTSFGEDCPFILAGDREFAGKEAAYFLAYSLVFVFVFLCQFRFWRAGVSEKEI